MQNESSCTSCLSRSRNVTFIFLVFVAIFQFADPRSTLAVPAAPIVHELVQPDGSRFQAKKWGDEWSHGWETVEGYTIMQEPSTARWMYAARNTNGLLMPTTRAVGIDATPANSPKHVRPENTTTNLSPSSQNKSAALSIAAQQVVPPTGTANIPVILINFSDTENSYTAYAFSRLLFGTGDANSSNNSMKDYYKEVSYGKFSVSAGPAGVLGWYIAKEDHEYYGNNGSNGNDKHPAELAIEAVKAADNSIDFSKYDSDGDCYVDTVLIVHQGAGEEDTPDLTDIWSHHSTLNYMKSLNDGTGEYTTNDTAACGSIKINDYTMLPEVLPDRSLHTIGVFAHEYGHSLGLHDLYDTDKSSKGVGNWCLMGKGSRNKSAREGSRDGDSPAHLSAWCKYKLGWVKPTLVTGKLVKQQINAASRYADVYQFSTGSPATGGEYFLIENRQRSGFDEGLPGSGLAIWHIDESKVDNTQECKTQRGCSAAHYKVALEQADSLFQLEKNENEGDASDLYSLWSEFTDSSVPDSLLYNAINYRLSVKDIFIIGDVMTATLDASDYRPSRISAGAWHTLFIKDDGSLWACGYNYYGQLGDGTTKDRHNPVRIGTDNDWQAVQAGSFHSLALKKNGSLWAWGGNEYGELGDGTTEQRNSPVQIGTDNGWQPIFAVEAARSIALKKNGTLWAWGYNGYGQLGDGTTEQRNSPVQISTENNWQAVAAGSHHTVALKSDGSLWVWGNNHSGQLGDDGTTETVLSPMRMGTESNWQKMASKDGYHTVAIKNDGSLWAWGGNWFGQLGDGTKEAKYSPIQISTENNWRDDRALSSHYAHNMTVKSDGSLWAWGYNKYGQLGDGTTEGRSPIRISTENDWLSVSAGLDHTVAIKTDGSLWAWGNNQWGQLGDGTTIDRHSPVPVFNDTDNDGIEDAWEIMCCSNLTTLNATSDYDKDGYSDKQEYLNWLAGDNDPNGTGYDPTTKNAPGGTGYQTPAKGSALPSIYKLLLKR